MEKMLQLKNYILLGFIIAVISLRICNCRPVGFSYAKFSGPVSGPEKEILVKDGHGRSYVDYIQKPDYSFAYGVDDPKTRVLQNRKESRHGDAVKGEYSVVDPDGTLRVVKYTADKKNGFQAEVITDGKSQMHGHDVSQHQPQHQTSYYHHPNPQTIQHHQQQHPPPPPPPPHHQEHNTPDHSYNDYDHYSHHEEQEPEYHQNVEAPVSAAYTSNTRHPPAPAPTPANTQYHQGGYSSGEQEQEEEDEYDDDGESGEDDDDESGEADDESGEDDY